MTQEPVNRQPVNLNPQEFVLDELPSLSLEEVIDRYVDMERQRTDHEEDEEQNIVSIGIRSLPNGLALALRSVCSDLDIKQHLVTRCATHHIASWYASNPTVSQIIKYYGEVLHDADGHPDVWSRVEEASFAFRNTVRVKHSSFHSIVWAKSRLDEMSSPLGVPTTRLFSLGLAWSLSTNSHNTAASTVNHFLLPEVSSFSQYLEERLLILKSYRDILKLRQGKR